MPLRRRTSGPDPERPLPPRQPLRPLASPRHSWRCVGRKNAGSYPDAPLKGDFNFDGYEDFALYNGRNGPYGSQTYNVYLYSPAKKTYVLSESFSDLAFGSLNFFEIDAKRKRLITFSKDGCCYHYDTEYVVRDNRPVPVLRTSREYRGSYELVTVEKFVGGKWKTTKRYRNQCQPA